MSLVTGLFFPVLLLNQRWSPPLRLQASRCGTFRSMCDVPSIAVFCSESIECFPGTASKFFLKLLVTIPVAPIIIGMIAVSLYINAYYYYYYYYYYYFFMFVPLYVCWDFVHSDPYIYIYNTQVVKDYSFLMLALSANCWSRARLPVYNTGAKRQCKFLLFAIIRPRFAGKNDPGVVCESSCMS